MSERTRWAAIKDKGVNWGFALLAVITFASVIGNVIQGHTNEALAQKALTTQHNFHQQNVATQAQIKHLTAETGKKDDAIIAAQQQGHALLMAVAGLQMEINQQLPAAVAGLTKGQAQINAYLHYLTCLGTNPTNSAVCGAAPPLPAA